MIGWLVRSLKSEIQNPLAKEAGYTFEQTKYLKVTRHVVLIKSKAYGINDGMTVTHFSLNNFQNIKMINVSKNTNFNLMHCIAISLTDKLSAVLEVKMLVIRLKLQ